MGMGFGMIGAIGGAGKGLSDQSAYLAKMEDEDRAEARTIRSEERGDTRQRSYQQWLLEQREQFDVRSEERADTRGEKKKDRDFEREKTEAPTRRSMKAEDITSEHGAKSAAAASTADTDAVVKKKMANAGVSDADEEVKGATADSLTANAEYTRGAKTVQAEALAEAKARAASGANKIDPADNVELKSAQERIKKLADMRDTMDSQGQWVYQKKDGPKVEVPEGQRRMEAELVVQQKKVKDILARHRGAAAAPPAAGPLPNLDKLRASAAGKRYPTEASMKGEGTQIGADPASMQREIDATQAALDSGEIDNPQDQENARGYLASLRAGLAKMGPNMTGLPMPAPKPATPKPAAPPPVVATPLPPSLTMGAPLPGADALWSRRARPDAWSLGKYAGTIEQLRAKAGITEDPGE